MNEMKFTWEWCGLCDHAFIRCPKCGNNCCNAGYGEVEGKPCDVCPLAYQYQDLAFKAELYPKNKEGLKFNKQMSLEEIEELSKKVVD